MQKFSKSGCVVGLVAWPLLSVLVYGYLPRELEEARPWFAGVSGLLLAMGVSSLFLLLTGQHVTREDVMASGESGRPPEDGDALLVTGRVRAAPPLLEAPLSGLPCLAYFYRMYRVVHNPDGPDEELPVYWGYASRPLTVETGSRSLAVAAPQLSIPRNRHGGAVAVARARKYVGAVAAEVRSPRPFFAGDRVLQWMTDIAPDEDGSARRDWKSGEDRDPTTLLLEELVLTPESEVSVTGFWSARHNALAAGEGARAVPPTLGPAGELGVGAGVPPSLLASWIGTLSTIALGIGLIWFALNVWPSLK
jgi:hypothetical protein